MCADDRPPSPRRTRWWLLALIAVIVLVPAVLVTRHIKQGSPTNESRAFAVRANGSRLALGSLGGDVYNATDVNDRDEVVGSALRSDGAMHAFISRDGKMTDLGTLGGDYSWATAINERRSGGRLRHDGRRSGPPLPLAERHDDRPASGLGPG